MNINFEYQQKDCEKIVPREFCFEFDDELDPVWIPSSRVRSHLLNGLSLTMPFLEPYLIRSIRSAKDHVTDPRLLEDMTLFCHQEANHYRCHRRFNEILKKNGYPELERLERHMKKAYARLERQPLKTQLAYSAGFESMTCGFTHWFLTDRVRLFADSDPSVSTFWIMHMIEEGEHKTVAFDAYMAYSGSYLRRALGVLHGSWHVLGLGLWGMFVSLKKDSALSRIGTWRAVGKELFRMFAVVGPYMFRAMLPGYDPRDEADPQWMMDWIDGFGQLRNGDTAPLLDTKNPQMPVPF